MSGSRLERARGVLASALSTSAVAAGLTTSGTRRACSDTALDEDERAEEYEKVVGHPPQTTDHPDWLYTGSKKEVEELKKRLGLAEEEEYEQMELW